MTTDKHITTDKGIEIKGTEVTTVGLHSGAPLLQPLAVLIPISAIFAN